MGSHEKRSFPFFHHHFKERKLANVLQAGPRLESSEKGEFPVGKTVLGRNSSGIQGQTTLENSTIEYLPRLVEQSAFIQAGDSGGGSRASHTGKCA